MNQLTDSSKIAWAQHNVFHELVASRAESIAERMQLGTFTAHQPKLTQLIDEKTSDVSAS